MKNFLKYFFSIMLMCSCLIVVSMFAYKTLFIDNKTPDGPGADNVTNEEDTGTGEKNPEAAEEEPVDKCRRQMTPRSLRRILHTVSYTHLDVYKRQIMDRGEAVKGQALYTIMITCLLYTSQMSLLTLRSILL